MSPSTASDNQISLALIEGCMMTILCAGSLAAPRLGWTWFARIEQAFTRLARRRRLAVFVVGFSTVVLRLAILPVLPVPLPFVPDDFSFLLAADTFLHGRLTNATPAMWTHFETIHVTMTPTYMSMYFPAQGLLLAAAKLVFGHPWAGLLLVSALMCAALCWMLQAWLPASWALLGGAIAVLHLGVFSYWTNTYHAAGSIGALGGALILGSLPRLMKSARSSYGLLLAAGIALLVLSRPYEGLLLCLPVAFALGRWAVRGKNRPAPVVLLRRAAFPLAIVMAAISWLGFYDYRAFGNATTLPYTIDRAQYALAPYYVWQAPRPEPVYRHDVLRSFYASYADGEMEFYARIHKPSGFIPETLKKAWSGLLFFAGGALLPPLLMIRRVFLDRRIRFLVVCLLVLLPGMIIEIFMLPHYVAPFTAVFYAIGLQCMRHLRVWKFEGKPAGRTLVRFLVTLCVVMACLRVAADPLHLAPAKWPPPKWNFVWYGPGHFGVERAHVADELERMPGRHLVFVRYAANHNVLDEWVYNAADIDSAKVIWARGMSSADNLQLIHYYQGRSVWVVDADAQSPEPEPYVGAGIASGR